MNSMMPTTQELAKSVLANIIAMAVCVALIKTFPTLKGLLNDGKTHTTTAQKRAVSQAQKVAERIFVTVGHRAKRFSSLTKYQRDLPRTAIRRPGYFLPN